MAGWPKLKDARADKAVRRVRNHTLHNVRTAIEKLRRWTRLRDLLRYHRLYQVPRMIHVISLAHRYVVSKELQRNYFDNGQ